MHWLHPHNSSGWISPSCVLCAVPATPIAVTAMGREFPSARQEVPLGCSGVASQSQLISGEMLSKMQVLCGRRWTWGKCLLGTQQGLLSLPSFYTHPVSFFFSLIFPNFLKNFEDAEKSKNSAVNPKILTRFLNFSVLSYLLDLSLHLSIHTHTHTSFLFCCFAGPLENKLRTSRCFTSILACLLKQSHSPLYHTTINTYSRTLTLTKSYHLTVYILVSPVASKSPS